MLSCSSDSQDSSAAPSSSDGTGGSLARFTLVGDYLYTVDKENLNVFNVSNTEDPEFVNNKFIGFEIETLFSFEEYLFVGSRLGMFIYDISDPINPLKLAEVSHFRSCDPVVSTGDYTFVTLHTNAACVGNLNQLEVYDTTNPLNPVLKATIGMDRPIGLGVYQNYLLVTDAGVVRIFNIDNPEIPDLIGGIQQDGFDVIVLGNRLFVIGETSLVQYKLNPDDILDYTELSTITF